MNGETRDNWRKNRNFGIWLGTAFLVAYFIIGAGAALSGTTSFGDYLTLRSALGMVSAASGGSFICACYYWAKYKNRSTWLAILGLLAPFGFIPLALMKDEGKS